MTGDPNPSALAPAGSAIPRLPSGDLARTEAFYAALGFRSRGARYDDYLVMTLDTIELHFLRFDFDPRTQAASVFVRVHDAAAWYHAADAAFPDIVRCNAGAISAAERAQVDEQVARGGSHARLHELATVPWGGRQFALIDPDGNLLQIGEAGSAG